MSQQAFVDFYEKYLNSPAGESARSRIDAITDPNEYCMSMAATGKAQGYDFSAEDVREVMKASEIKMAKAVAEASGELSEDQLAGVAGGTMTSYTSIQTVSISTLPKFISPKLDLGTVASTVMCPW